MYKVKVIAHFSGAHNLIGYDGPCEDLHGHNWRIEVSAHSEELDDLGMVVDFKELKGALKECLAGLDHKHLNEVEYFKTANPTSENIAKYIFDEVSGKIKDVKICKVTVYETDTSCATYTK